MNFQEIFHPLGMGKEKDWDFGFWILDLEIYEIKKVITFTFFR